jgi:metal-sulfur cluster biosynthetic enzyme
MACNSGVFPEAVMNENTQALEQAVVEPLQTVIDPETGADVWRMRFVENLTVDEKQTHSCTQAKTPLQGGV